MSCTDFLKALGILCFGVLSPFSARAQGQPIPPSAPDTAPEQQADSIVRNMAMLEELPVFPGGEAALLKYIADNTHYPEVARENGIEGKVFVQFVIDRTGHVTDAAIRRSAHPELDREALRVVNSLPPFERPGMMNGKPVLVMYTLPLTFRLK